MISFLTSSVRSMFGARHKTARRVSGKRSIYPSSQTDRLNEYHWTYATNSDPAQVLLDSLNTLRNRLRLEIRRNGWVAGVAGMYAEDVVGGTGPTLKLTSESPETIVTGVRRDFEMWANRCDPNRRVSLAAMILSGVRRLATDGEFFLALGDAPDPFRDPVTGFPMSTLEVRPIAPERIATPPEKMGDPNVLEGVQLDDEGRVLGYWVSKAHPQQITARAFEFEFFPRNRIIHYFEAKWPGQVRGEPWMQSALDRIADLRSYTADTLMAARIIARMGAAVIESDVPVITSDGDETESELNIFNLLPGLVPELPEGKRLNQVRPEQPSEQYVDHIRMLLTECFREKCIPLIRILLDASESSYSAARLDTNGYSRIVSTEQDALARQVLTIIFATWFQDYRIVTNRFLRNPRVSWVWHPPVSVDPVKDAKAVTERLKNGTSSIQRECASDGQDYDEVQSERRASREVMLECGLIQAPAPPAMSEGSDDDTDTEDGDE